MFFIRGLEDDGESCGRESARKMEILADEEEVDNNMNNNMSSFNTNETMVVLVNADDHERETIARSEYFNHAKSVKRMHEDIQDGAKVLMHSYREHLANIGKMQGADWEHSFDRDDDVLFSLTNVRFRRFIRFRFIRGKRTR